MKTPKPTSDPRGGQLGEGVRLRFTGTISGTDVGGTKAGGTFGFRFKKRGGSSDDRI